MANNIQPRLYISELNNYCLRKNMKVSYEEISVTGPPHNMEFTFKAVIGDRDFPEGKGKSKKEAKNVAAKQALLILEKEDMSSVMSPQPSQNSSVSESQTPPNMNYIAFLNKNVQKKRLTLDFIKQSPTSGFSSFSYICKVGKISYGPGRGSNKQEAKQAAAKIACQTMQLGDISQESDSTPSSACALPCTDSSSTSMSTSTSNGVVVESGFSENTSERNNNNSLQNISSWSPKSTGGCQQKVKRVLAPTFQKQLDNNEKEENMYSCNERFLNDFYDIKILSRGGYGQVFKGIHKLDKKSYAIKRVKFDNEKVEREVEVLAKLDHENIIKYSHCWAGDDKCDTEKSGYFSRSKCLFIVMELCERGTLKDWIDHRRGSELDKALPLNLFQQITAGVEYIHSNNLIHRDLKPSNIFLVDETKIKIGDFGLVTLLKTKDDRTKGVGTPLYMSPEQIFSLEYGNEVDIFALGLILFQLLYISATVQEISKIWENVKKCVFPEEFINKYPKEQLMVVKLLSKKPEDRPKASNILRILKAWEKEESGREIMYPRTC